jgi:hypothetical protein
MLRMGTPKTRNETQNRGSNRISQSFIAQADSISVALYLLSLDHRGDDTLRISLTRDADGEPIASENAFDLGNGSQCAAPCAQTIDVGKRKDVIDSGWQNLRFGLEQGKAYTLEIELEAGQNESLASWLYVDGVNEPPSAVINFNPGSQSNTKIVEGDFVVFDCLDSVDPENSDISCLWTAAFPGVSAQKIVGKTVVYLFPDEGTGTVHLEVTDGEESTTTSQTIGVQNQPPLVSALDAEVLPGHSVDLVCRWADPGAFDTHSFDFSISGAGTVEVLPDTVDTENVPALASGVARAVYTAPADPVSAPVVVDGSCSVTDSNGDTTSDPFTITVLPPAELAARVSANTPSTLGTPQTLRAGKSSLGALQTPESIAVYEITLPFGTPLPSGTEVAVTAHFPVDYDIVLLSGSADPTVNAAPFVSAPFVSAPFVSAPFVSAPFVSAPFVSAPFVSAPFVSAPFVSAPFVSAPFVSAPFVSAPFVSAPFVSAPVTTSLWDSPGFFFENFPLSQLAGAPDGSNISGLDISFEDLGALSSGTLVEEPVFVKGISAEFGGTEQLLVEVSPGERGLYLAVIPQAGSFSAAPFSLEVEAAVPPPTTSLLGPACDGELLVTTPSGEEVLRSYGEKTLVITQKQRLMATFGMDETAFNEWLTAMDPFFSHPKVAATVISVDSGLYNAADSNPCVVAEQNALAQAIKARIDQHRTDNTEYVQIMGSLDIVPPRYVPDETLIGNEALFAADLLTLPGTPLGVAISEGFMLTDAYYVDSDPQPFNGRQLYLEDISVSRLVETPAEMLANAQRFVATGGVINLLSVEAGTPGAGTQSTGYDFFIDGTEVINSILDSAYPGANTTLNNDLWDAQQLRCQFFGTGEGCSKPVSAVNAVNAHMSYNAGLTAKGFNCQYLPEEQRPAGLDCGADPDPLGEVFLSSESAAMYQDPDEDGPGIDINGITFSIGCHSGLSVPDAWALPEQLGLPLDPARDWVQELGTWVGSYNFAYGDTDVDNRGTEGIMPLVIEKFAQGMTLGEALTQAKWQYGAGLFEFGVYDEKSLVGLNLFGMPQATLEGGLGDNSGLMLAAAGSTSSASPTPAGDLSINYTVTDGVTTEPGDTETVSGSMLMQSNENGVWYSVDGTGFSDGAQGIFGRPLLPVVKPFELQAIGESSIHGVALRGGTYNVYLDQNPVFPAQTHDLVTVIDEPQPCVETLSPALVSLVNGFDAPSGRLETFIVQPGQFECTDSPLVQQGDGYMVNGRFRIWETLDLYPLRPTTSALDADRKPPVVTQQDLLGDPVTGVVTATLNAGDESGIREIIALVYRDDDGVPGGTGTATAYSVPGAGGGPYELTLPDAFANKLSFQYVDNAGNITWKTLKGQLLRAIEVSIRTSIISSGTATDIVVQIGDWDTIKLLSPYLTIDFGDDTQPQLLELDGGGAQVVQPDGTVLTVEIIENDDGTATVVIPYNYGLIENAITVSVEVRASGAVGSDEKTITACSDPLDADIDPSADIVGCAVSSDDTRLTVDVILEGPVAPDVQYRLVLPETNTQIKYADGATTGPNRLKPEAILVGDNQISFMLDAARLGWDGISPLQFLFETQDGVAGGQGEGFVDSTTVKTYLP